MWFTAISVVSLRGIMISMYIILTITKSISKDVYVNMGEQYSLNFDNTIERFEEQFNKKVFS